MRKKYYRVTLRNIGEHTENVKDVMYSIAIEENGICVDCLTNKQIYFSDDEPFNARKFLKQNASLYGIEKLETTAREVSKGFLFVTDDFKRQYIQDILELERLTKEEAEKRYAKYLESVSVFVEKFGGSMDLIEKEPVVKYVK